jgi:hypothetical protein
MQDIYAYIPEANHASEITIQGTCNAISNIKSFVWLH